MARWTLVGRDDALESIREALRSDLPAVVLTGDPGIGKTEVARAALEDAVDHGHPTHWIDATSGLGAVPYGAVAHLLPERPGSDRHALVDAIVTSLAAGSERRVVLVVDDASLLDPRSSELVTQLVDHPDTFAVLTTEATGKLPQRLTGTGAQPVELGPLAHRDHDTLVAKLLLAPVDPAVPEHVWEVARGNPLFARELVLAAREDGDLAERDGTWGWSAEPTLPTTVSGVLDARLAAVATEERSVLDLLAVAEPVEHAAAAQLATPETVDALSVRRLIEIHQTKDRQRVRLAHPLYGESLRSELAPDRRGELLIHLADVIGAAGARRSDDPLRLVTFRMEAGAPVEQSLLDRAARQAVDLCDEALAEEIRRGERP